MASDRVFIGTAALLFVLSTTITLLWCDSMSTMSEMPMPGGWTMSMAWMRMPGQSWLDAAVSFLGMWAVMMVAMMLPSLVPMLRHYRDAMGGAGTARCGRLMLLVGSGYFLVWTLLGVAIFPGGVALAALEMRVPALARAVPLTSSAVVLVAGLLQFTRWKARQLLCCRHTLRDGERRQADASSAWRHGLRLGLHCVHCCAPLTAVLLVIGVMDLLAMALVTSAITFERLAPHGARSARITGVGIVAAGAFLLWQALQS